MESKFKSKKLLIYPPRQGHTLFKETLLCLGKNYTLINPSEKRSNLDSFSKSFLKKIYLRKFYHEHIRKYLSLNDLRNIFKNEEEIDCDLILSINSIPPYNKPYILSLEIITALTGYNYQKLDKNKIKRQFENKNCRAIIAWNESAKNSLIKTINCKKFTNKISIVPFSIQSKKIPSKTLHSNQVNILFVSSINNPQDFEFKGGLIALETYRQLVKEYSNLSFTIRAKVPNQIKKEYGSIKGLKIIEEFLPAEAMEKLFLNSDILLVPVPGINLLLDCMNYKLPVVAFDFWVIPEMVINKKTGLLIGCSPIFGKKKDIETFVKNLHLNYFKLCKKNIDSQIINAFYDSTLQLIENKRLRQKMGDNSKKMLEKGGQYNLDSINTKFLKIINHSF